MILKKDLKSAGGLFMSTVVIFSEMVFSSAMRKGGKLKVPARWVKCILYYNVPARR